MDTYGGHLIVGSTSLGVIKEVVKHVHLVGDGRPLPAWETDNPNPSLREADMVGV